MARAVRPRRAALVVAVSLGVSALFGAAPVQGQGPGWRVVIAFDPGCVEARSILEHVKEFRRLRPNIPVQLLLPNLNAFARVGAEVLAVLHETALTLEWDPNTLRALGVRATPTVVVLDRVGRGVRAEGTPDLAALMDAARAQ